MGQYYYVVNIDKKQYLHPHRFGDGLKLLEFGCSAMGTLTGLAVLLASGNGRGGGDLRSNDPIVGSWAGDRIVVAGDYADPGAHLTPELIDQWREYLQCRGEDAEGELILQTVASYMFEDISKKVIDALRADRYIAERLTYHE